MGNARMVAVAGAMLAIVAGGPAVAQQARYAERGATGGYGGGLIEFLVTGRSDRPTGTWPQPARAAQAAYGAPPRYGAQPVSAGGQGYAGQPGYASQPAYAVQPNPAVQRQAALIAGDRVPPYGEPSTMPYAAALPEPEPVYARQPEPVYARQPDPAYGQQPDPRQQEYRVQQAPNPQFQRQEVAFDGPQRPGSILVDTNAKYLFLVQPGHRAIRYGIGVGRPGFSWSGLKTVSRKAEWPDWIPPAEMLARRPDLPRHMAGGPANPLGARALYLGSSLYRIHGTNEPDTIGRNVSSGCIRMMNDDVIDLYERVPVGTQVQVL